MCTTHFFKCHYNLNEILSKTFPMIGIKPQFSCAHFITNLSHLGRSSVLTDPVLIFAGHEFAKCRGEIILVAIILCENHRI